jgi:hypothetical protein
VELRGIELALGLDRIGIRGGRSAGLSFVSPAQILLDSALDLLLHRVVIGRSLRHGSWASGVGRCGPYKPTDAGQGKQACRTKRGYFA